MRNMILLLVLISGFAAGYWLGDYRGRDARKALAAAVETGKTLEQERQTSKVKLETELAAIDARYQREQQNSRQLYDVKAEQWLQTKTQLDQTIAAQNRKVLQLNQRINELALKRNENLMADKTAKSDSLALEQQIAKLRDERDSLIREADGNACLLKPVPHSVLEALNDFAVKGK